MMNMVVIKERKPFKVGDSIAIALPPDHTMNKSDSVMLIANSVILIHPKDMEPEKVKQKTKELVEEL